jgi:hypothetical protein
LEIEIFQTNTTVSNIIDMENLELRMYGLTNYQLTGIQKGIQFLHGVVEYGQMANRIGGNLLNKYNDWANNWKTVILLNGGTTNTNLAIDGFPVGTLNKHLLSLEENGIDFSQFYEPDLGDQLTSVAFIVDERVFNRKKYPDFEDWVMLNYEDFKKHIIGDVSSYQIARRIKESSSKECQKVYKEWVQLVGGEKNVFLRDFLKDFKLA